MTRPESPVSAQSLLAVAVEAARAAGSLIREGLAANRSALGLEKKGAVDLVTVVDRRAEAAAIEIVGRSFPDHSVLAEEGGGSTREAGYQWLIDPLDGTTNFAHRHPQCGVSVAVLEHGEPVVGVVFDPAREELFTATAGGGAYLNGKVITVSGVTLLDDSLLATGFGFDRRERSHVYLPIFTSFLVLGQGVRRMGAAALDLAWLAAGRLDGFWEMALHAWDVGAGVLLVREAGGRVSDYGGDPLDLLAPTRILASNGHLHEAMLAVLADHEERWRS